MSLVFQDQVDGYRVLRQTGNHELMLARLYTRRAVYRGNPEYAALLQDHLEDVRQKQGIAAAVVAGENATKNGLTLYSPLSRGDCLVHSASGALSVADLEEILAGLSTPPGVGNPGQIQGSPQAGNAL